VFQQHVAFGRESDTSSEQVFDAGSLFEQGVDKRCSLRDEWGLQQIREDRQHGMHRLEFRHLVSLKLNTLAKLSKDDQVINERGSQQ